jgi:hypothetical protein
MRTAPKQRGKAEYRAEEWCFMFVSLEKRSAQLHGFNASKRPPADLDENHGSIKEQQPSKNECSGQGRWHNDAQPPCAIQAAQKTTIPSPLPAHREP